jgi:hypothetical protein
VWGVLNSFWDDLSDGYITQVANTLTAGVQYIITSVGSTNYNTAAGTSGVFYTVGSTFTAANTGNGTGVVSAYYPLKCTFDGDNKLIYVNTQYSSVNVKVDMYSASKRWLKRRQNLAYLPPIRAIGGDLVDSTNGIYAGDLYFLENNWQVIIDHQVSVNGVLYQDNPALTTYVVQSGGGVISTVSNLAYSYNTLGTTVPTTAQITDAILGANPTGYAGTSTVGGKISDTFTEVDAIKTDTSSIIALTV